jgi:hypothetical protein
LPPVCSGNLIGIVTCNTPILILLIIFTFDIVVKVTREASDWSTLLRDLSWKILRCALNLAT